MMMDVAYQPPEEGVLANYVKFATQSRIRERFRIQGMTAAKKGRVRIGLGWGFVDKVAN